MSGAPGEGPKITLNVYGITKDGKLWRTSHPENTDGSVSTWSSWEAVRATGQNEPRHFVSIASVDVFPIGSHVLGITQDGTLWHTSHVEQGWQPFENLSAQIEGNEGKLLQVAVTTPDEGGQLDAFVIAQTKQEEQRILHTSLRLINGAAWENFADITQPELAGFPGSFTSVGCAYTSGLLQTLQVCGTTKDGNLWHTLNFPNPFTTLGWLPFANVQLLSNNVPTPLTNVSLAQGADGLEVCALSKGNLWHTSRSSGNQPAWQPTFDNISEEGAGKPGPFGSVSCGEVNQTLHACGVTPDGKIWHSNRTSTNPVTWQAFEDITAAIGSPGHFSVVCVANSALPGGFSGSDLTCAQIIQSIGNDRLQMRGAAIQARNALQQDINHLINLGKQKHCPGM